MKQPAPTPPKPWRVWAQSYSWVRCTCDFCQGGVMDQCTRYPDYARILRRTHEKEKKP
jgi:hypothetical protein